MLFLLAHGKPRSRPRTGISYWQAQLAGASENVAPPSPSGFVACPAKVDFVIIGGGLAGIATATRISESVPGASVAVLEAESVGYGASGRNAGLISPLPAPIWLVTADEHADHAWALKRMNEATHRLAAWLAEAAPGSRVSQTTLRIEATGAVTRAGLERVRRVLGRCDVAHARAKEEGRAPLVLEVPAHTIDPYGAVLGLAAAARKSGVSIHEGVSVAAVTEEKDAAVVRLTDGRTIEARAVVVCSNAYSSSMRLPGKVRARAIYNYMLATSELPSDLISRFPVSRVFAVELNTDYVFYRLHERRLIYGGIDRVRRQVDDFAVPDKVLAALERLMDASLPGTRLMAERAWAGRYHMTHTELPQIERVGARGAVVLNVGYGGTGIALTLICARLAASMATGKPIEDPDERRLLDILQATRLPVIAGARLAAGVAGDLVFRRRPAV